MQLLFIISNHRRPTCKNEVVHVVLVHLISCRNVRSASQSQVPLHTMHSYDYHISTSGSQNIQYVLIILHRELIIAVKAFLIFPTTVDDHKYYNMCLYRQY
jgi:hypothetical protein